MAIQIKSADVAVKKYATRGAAAGQDYAAFLQVGCEERSRRENRYARTLPHRRTSEAGVSG